MKESGCRALTCTMRPGGQGSPQPAPRERLWCRLYLPAAVRPPPPRAPAAGARMVPGAVAAQAPTNYRNEGAEEGEQAATLHRQKP